MITKQNILGCDFSICYHGSVPEEEGQITEQEAIPLIEWLKAHASLVLNHPFRCHTFLLLMEEDIFEDAPAPILEKFKEALAMVDEGVSTWFMVEIE